MGNFKNQEKVIIFSAPSGSGKTTIVKHLLENRKNLDFSISACTRKAREGEVDAQDYYFLEMDDFKKKIEAHEFAEWEEVYGGNYYGTLKSEIERIWALGKYVIFDVDVKGGLKLKEYFGEKALAVFVKVPSLDDLAKRLNARGTETEASLKKRLDKAVYEMSFETKFDVTVLNENVESAFKIAEKNLNDFLN